MSAYKIEMNIGGAAVVACLLKLMNETEKPEHILRTMWFQYQSHKDTASHRILMGGVKAFLDMYFAFCGNFKEIERVLLAGRSRDDIKVLDDLKDHLYKHLRASLSNTDFLVIPEQRT